MGTLGTRGRNGKRSARGPDRPHPAVAKLAALLSEHKEALEQQKATSEILNALSRASGDPQPVFQAIVDQAHRLCRAVYTILFRYDGIDMTVGAMSGFAARGVEIAKSRYPSPPRSDHIVGRAILEGKPQQSVDVTADKRFPANHNDAFAKVVRRRAVLVVPLMRDASVIGAISVGRAEAQPFTKSQERLLQTFAEHAVIAIEKVRLVNETQEALEHQKTSADILRIVASSVEDADPVFKAITEAGMRLVPGCRVALHLLREGTLHYASHSGVSPQHWEKVAKFYPMVVPSDVPSAKAVAEKRVIHVPDIDKAEKEFPRGKEIASVSGWRSILSVPLMRGNEAIGNIAITRLVPGPFTDKQIAVVQTFADQAVIAIENARLFNETKESLEQQSATAEILRVISSTPTDIQPVFEAIAKSAMRIFEGLEVAVALVDGSEFEIKATSVEQARTGVGLRLPLDRNSAGGLATLERIVVNIADTESAQTPPVTRDRARALGFRAFAAAPMIREGAAVGHIAVMRERPVALTDKQVALLKTFAAQAVIAIENARLFNETKEALDQQTATAEILKVISSSPTDMQPVFEAIVESAARLFAPLTVVIAMREGEMLHRKARAGPTLVTTEKEQADLQNIWPRPLDPNVSISARAILERRAVEVLDVEAEGSEVARRIGRISKHRSATALPLLRSAAEAIGAIVLTRPEAGHKLTDKQLSLLRTFADQAVIAIENVRLFKELQSTNASLRESLEQQTATGEILKTISSSATDVMPVFETIIRNAVRLGGAQFGTVFRLETDQVAIGAHFNVRAEAQEIFTSSFPQRLTDGSPYGRAMLRGQIVNVADHALGDFSAASKERARALRSRAILAVPMLKDGRAVGAIAIGREQPGEYSASYVALVKTFADQAVIAIENVRLFNETKEALERQTATAEILKVIASSPADTQPVFDAIAASAQKLFDAPYASVMRRVDDTLHLAAHTVLSESAAASLKQLFPTKLTGEGAVGRAVLESVPAWITDIETDPAYSASLREGARVRGYRSLLAVPMLREGEAIGAIAVTRREPGPFSEHQVSLLKTFADQAVIAIENVRLFNETKEALEQQTATAEILKVISSSPTDVQPVFEAIVQRAMHLVPPCGIGLNMVQGNEIYQRAAAGPEVTPQARAGLAALFPIPLDRQAAGSALAASILERRVIEVLDTEAPDAPPKAKAGGRAANYRSITFIPLVRDDQGIGAIGVAHPQPGFRLSEKQLAMLKTFAAQAVIAIENVRLFNDTKEALEQQKSSAEVLQAISSSIADTKPVFDKILRSCERLFEGHYVGIGLMRDDGMVHLAAYHGAPGLIDAAEKFEQAFPVPLSNESALGRAILSRDVMHYPDIPGGADVPPYLRRSAERNNTKSVIVAPLLWEGRSIGGIFVGRNTLGPFPEKAIGMLKMFADQAAIAIENVRLFREIEEKSAQLEVANKHKSEFLANMSHELRTPLNAIIGFSEVLNEGMFGELNEKQADYLRDIHESGKHLLSLINDILDLSKIEAGRMDLEVSSFDLPAALSNAMTLIRERAQRHAIELGLDIDPQLGNFQGDERKFKQIMLNLLSNAVKFTPDGGRVDVRAKREDAAVEVAVKDTGIGIAAEDQALVFEEFRQVGRDRLRKAEGTGLGLALTKRFVELHGGAIRLESIPGKGSTFTVFLPIRS